MANFTSILAQLQQARTHLASQLQNLNNAISALTGTPDTKGRSRISAAGRERIAAAQRARWAKLIGAEVSTAKRTRRPLSPAARRRIAAAQKARWAAWRKGQKAA